MRSCALIWVMAIGCFAVAGAHFARAQAPRYPVAVALDGNRGPFQILFTRDGKTAYVTEFDEGSVAIVDAERYAVVGHLPTGGEEPTGLALTPDERFLLVTNSFDGSLAILDVAARRRVAAVRLPGMPYDVVVSPDGARAYVAVSQLDEVAVIDLARREVVARVGTGYRPKALALTPDGRTLLTANQTGGNVSVIDTQALREVRRVQTPAVNLRDIALSPDGRLAMVTSQRAQNERPTATPIGIWSNQLFPIVVAGPGSRLADNIWVDFLTDAGADPDGVVFDPSGERAIFTCAGGHGVVRIRAISGPRGYEPVVAANVGANPRGIALRPGGEEVWVANHLGNRLVVLDPRTLERRREIALPPASRRDPHLLGRFLFTSAHYIRGKQFTCFSCHSDGNMDGISWKFVHVKDGLGSEQFRNVRDLRGPLLETLPLRWTGLERDLTHFVKTEVEELLQSHELSDAEIRALADYVASLRMPPNPYRQPDGSFTPAALRGRALFEGKAECSGCHAGPHAGGGAKYDLGFTQNGTPLEVPHLVGVYDTAPYLHDGRARTLEEIFTRHNPQQTHGKAHLLTPEELQDLIRYLKEL